MHSQQQGNPSKTQHAFVSLVDMLQYRAETQPEDLAFTFLLDGEVESGSLTYAQLDARARTLACRLLTRTTPGERALLLYPSSLDYIIGFFGCLYAGVIPVTVYPPKRNRPDRRLEGIIRDAGPAVALCHEKARLGIEACLKDLPATEKLQLMAADLTDAVDGGAWSKPDVGTESLAYLQYTSGSTDQSKGVMVSHGNLLQAMKELDLSFHLGRGRKMVSWLPISHDFGLIFGVLLSVFSGIPCYLMSPLAFLQKPIRWLQAISTYGGTDSPAPNFGYDLCVEKIDTAQRDQLDLSSWQVAAIGAEPIRATTLREFSEFFAPVGFQRTAISPGFGLAESTLKATAIGLDQDYVVTDVYAEKLGKDLAVSPGDADAADIDANTAHIQTLVSSGHPLGDTRVAIVDPDSQEECADNSVGEIWIAGPIVAGGYWNQPEETRKTFQGHLTSGVGPFLRTGDLGFIRDGECYVTGRLKDVVIVRGVNHYPQDIEATVQRSHPALRPDFGAAFSVTEDNQERLVVVQELRRTSLKEAHPEQIFAAIRRAILQDHDLKIHTIALLRTASIRRTSSGKIQRQACQSQYLAEGFPTVAVWHLGDDGSSAAPLGSSVSVTSHAARDWLIRWVASRCERSENTINPQDAFDVYGMDSLTAVDLSQDLGDWIGMEIDETIVWNYPTISALAKFAAGEREISDHGQTPKPLHAPKSTRQQHESLDGLSDDELVGLLYEEIRTNDPE
jgi:acyl-CoA synthetase (AMP-forming)/AMP-acid ligase II/acyl carrier protein